MGNTPAGLPPIPPGTSDPNVVNAVPDVSRSNADLAGGVMGGLGRAAGVDFNTTPLGQQISRAHETRLANARRHYENATNVAGALSLGDIDPNTGQPTGINPDTQKPMSPEERAHYEQIKEGAWGDYAKVAGVSPEAKQQLEKHKGILDFATTKGAAALQKLISAHQQAASAAGQPAKSPTPPPSPTDIPAAAPAAPGTPAGGGAGATSSSASSGGPPALPSPSANPQSAAGGATAQPASPKGTSGYDRDAQLAMPMFRSNLAAYTKSHQELLASPEGPMAVANRKNIADNILHMTPGTRDYEQYIAHNTFPLVRGIQPKTAIGPNGEITAAGYDSTTGTLVGPDNQPLPEGWRIATAAEVGAQNIPKPMAGGYKGPNGEHLPGFILGVGANRKLYDSQMHPLPADTELFDAGLAPKTTSRTTEHIDPLTGERETLHSSSTTQGATGSAGSGGATSAGGTAKSPKKLPGPPSASAPSKADADRKAAYQHRQDRLDSQADKAPAAILGMGTYAVGTLKALDDASAAMDRLQKKDVMGNSWAKNKLEDALFRNGVVDPTLSPEDKKDIGTLRAALSMGASGALRAHSGRSPQVIYEEFKQNLGPGQDWDALRGAMGETKSVMEGYRDAAKDSNIRKLRGLDDNAAAPSKGTLTPPPSAKPTNAQDYLKSIGLGGG